MVTAEWCRRHIEECRETIRFIDEGKFTSYEQEPNGARTDATPELREACESIIQDMLVTLELLEQKGS